jgi:hypothetical protein
MANESLSLSFGSDEDVSPSVLIDLRAMLADAGGSNDSLQPQNGPSIGQTGTTVIPCCCSTGGGATRCCN